LFALALFVFIAVAMFEAHAAPANPHPFYFTQPNGTEITLFFRGDEFFAWWEDENGNIVAFDAHSGSWRYAAITDAAITPVGHAVGSPAAAHSTFTQIGRDSLLPLIQHGWRFNPGNPSAEFLNGRIYRYHGTSTIQSGIAVPTLIRSGLQAAPAIPHSGTTSAPDFLLDHINWQDELPPGSGDDSSNSGGSGSSGGGTIVIPQGFPVIPAFAPAVTGSSTRAIQLKQRLLVLLLEFDDMPLQNSSAFFHNKYFGTAPTAITIANYFRDMSGGRDIFIPAGNVATGGTFLTRIQGSNLPWAADGVDVTITPSTHSGIVRVRLHMPHPVAAWTVPAGHNATREVISLALAAIHNNNPNFNFSDIHIAAVFAGGEASDHYNPAPGGQIWAHAWQYRGALVGQSGWMRYMAYGERQRGGQTMGIGLPVHELGHLLGLPDLYDLSGQSEGVGPYSLMAHGAWGMAYGDPAVGHRPTALDPWSRIQLGYARPEVVSQNWRGSINSLHATSPAIIKVLPDADGGQSFLVENRQMGNRWDAGLWQWIRSENITGGIVIYHVDENMRRENPADMTGNNNNPGRLMVGVREADGSNFLLTAVARWRNKNDHFFSYGAFGLFGPQTSPASHFHSTTGRNAATGIVIIVHSERRDEMEVEVIFE